MRFLINFCLKFEISYYPFHIPLYSTQLLVALKNDSVRETLHTLATGVEFFKDFFVGDQVSLDLELLGKDPAAAIELADEQSTVALGVQVEQTHFFKTLIVQHHFQCLAANQLAELWLAKVDVLKDELLNISTLLPDLVLWGPVVGA